MKKKQKVKYIIAIYAIVAGISIILWLLAYNRIEDIYQATLLNLATEVFGVVLIFFVVNYLFTLDEWELSERVDKLLLKLEKDETRSADDFFHNRPDLELFIKEAKKIDLCGVVLSTTIDANLLLLKNALLKGVDIRILITELNEVNSKVIDSQSYKAGQISSDYYLKKHEAVVHNIKSLFASSEKFKGKLEVGTLPYVPAFGLKLFQKNRKQCKCIVEIYGFRANLGFWPNFSLDKDLDGKWFEYFQDQFEIMWSQRTNLL